MNELLIWCNCGWTKRGIVQTWAWLRILIHQYRCHRQDPTYWEGNRNGVTRIWKEPSQSGPYASSGYSPDEWGDR